MDGRELADSICATLRRNGYQALLAGGCVRDVLLGRSPLDYDVATDAIPEQVMALFPESVAVGAQFGVVVVPGDGCKVEVATFRSDLSYSDGRRPDRVVYDQWPADAARRR
jgi:poly(A) polymerase